MQKTLLFTLFTAALYSAKSCGCGKGDVACLAKCNGLPDPTEDQTDKTNECVTKCTDNGETDECFTNCINQIFKDYQKDKQTHTAPAPSPTTVSPGAKTTTDSATKGKEATTTTSGDKSATSAANDATTKPKASTTARSATTGSNNPVQTIGAAISSSSFSAMLTAFGIVASFFI